MEPLTKNEPPLDEIQWSSPQLVFELGGVHANTVLFYFAGSPFFDRTSNNAVVFSQAVRNVSQHHIVANRSAFEARLREMSGLEYVVHQEGMATGVWIIRKQNRRKVKGDNGLPAPDEVEVLADYFLIGENIYTAPTLSDILSSRVATISTAISKMFPAINSIQKWTPSAGHSYKTPAATAAAPGHRPKGLESKEPTPMPMPMTDGMNAGGKTPDPNQHHNAKADRAAASALDARLAEESFAIHIRFGGEYMDENPITGKPGEFHLSSTGRRDNRLAPPKAGGPAADLPPLKTLPDNSPLSNIKDGKGEKAGKSGGPPKPKRRKSKGGTTPS